MTAIRNSPQPTIRGVPPQGPAASAEAPKADVPAARPSSPSSAYAAMKKKLVSITGRHRAPVVLPGQAMDLKSLLASLRAGPNAAGKPAAGAIANPTDAQRAEEALKAGSPPPADHPRMEHVKDVKEQLKNEGLPTDADGVHVYVVDQGDHGGMVARTIGGPAGLAPGAELELSERLPDVGASRLPDEDARMIHEGAALSVAGGSASTEELQMWAVDALEATYLQPKAELDYLVAHAPKDGQTKIVNMSWGHSEDALVAKATKATLEAGATAPLIEELNAARTALGKPALDLKKPEAKEEVRQFIAGKIHSAVATGDGANRVRAARSEATVAVARAREAGFLPIAAAGNFFESRTGDGSRTNENLVATIPGVLSVGSVEMGDVKVKGDEKMGKSSSAGAAVSAPGVGVPVEIDQATGKTKDVDGTSFAAPYVASVAALMVKANPNITPAQIEKILQSPAVTSDVKGTRRDGAGVIDPVAAVREAKALMKTDGVADFHTSQDLDPAARRAAHDALRKLMPTTSPAFKAAINVINDDHFVELEVQTQKNLLAGLAAHKDDTTIGKDVTKLAASPEFKTLGPAARARFAQNFVGLEPNDRAEAMKLLKRPDLAKLPAQIKDAITAAGAKAPSDPDAIAALVKRANDPAFRKLPADAQAAFFRAFEHQHDTLEMDPAMTNKENLLKLVDSPEFAKLDGLAQSRWMQALGSDDPAVRQSSHERLDDAAKQTAGKSEAEKREELNTRAGALDAPHMVRTDRKKLPGASAEPPDISAAQSEQRSVFFKADGKGIDPKKADVLVHTVTIEGQQIEVVYPRPMPKDVPSPELIAKGLAGLPAAERAHLEQVIVDPKFKSFMQATSANDGRPNRVFMGGEVPDNQREMTAMLSHEAAHLLSADQFKANPALMKKWEAAIKADNHRVSDYATTHLQEDVAETVAHYYQVKGTSDEAVMKRDFPNRYALMKELLGE